MATFDVRDIFTIAMKIEENGQAFYAEMAQRQSADELRGFFAFLADEEARHQKAFAGMLANLSAHQPVESAPTEYFDYLQAYVDVSIFRPDLSQEELEALRDLPSAINYSLSRESDSILYYHEIKGFLPESDYAQIEKIIEEERRHYVKLSQLAKQLAA